MKNNIFSLFMYPPNSVEKLFTRIKQSISIFEPSWCLKLKPAPEEEIHQLEKMLIRKYGKKLPLSIKTYLQQMGEDDGGLVSQSVDYELEYWNYFKGHNMAEGIRENAEDAEMERHIKQILNESPNIPPFWYFYYTMLTGEGWGFSPATKSPDQIIETHENNFYFAHDTFSKLLFYFAYLYIQQRITNYSSMSRYIRSMEFCAECSNEWSDIGYPKLVDFLIELERTFSIRECWFSGNKEFNLFDAKDTITNTEYGFSRYVGSHTMSDLIISVRYYQNKIYVNIIWRDDFCTKQIVDAILQQVKLQSVS